MPIVMCKLKFDVVAFVPVRGLRCSKTSALLHALNTRCRATAQCSRSKISDHVKRVREMLSMRALWEQSLVYTCCISTSSKMTWILRKRWWTGRRIWFSSKSKIKDYLLNQRRWTCWFCICCLSHVTLWRLSLNVLYFLLILWWLCFKVKVL